MGTLVDTDLRYMHVVSTVILLSRSSIDPT
jgi:hypothetical protein